MGGISLAANNLKVPEQPNALEQYARIMQLQQQQKLMPGQLQQQQQQLQAGDLENQSRQMDITSQKALMKAYEESGGNLDKAVPLAAKYGAKPDAVIKLREASMNQQKQNIELLNTKGARAIQEADLMAGAHDAVAAAKPEDRPGLYQQQLAGLHQAGVDISQAPPQYPGDEQFKVFGIGIKGHKQQLEDLFKQAETAKNTAQAKADNANAEKTTLETQQLQQYGGMSPAAADAKYRFLQQKLAAKQEVTADDQNWIKGYEKQKLLVPGTTANLRMEGMGKIRQFPVYDNQTKQTVYMDSNEINDAKLTQPGRFVVPQFSTEAITQQQTGKAFAPGGKGGEEALAFQTAMQHADLLKKAAQALNNGDIRTLNSLKNSLATEFGDADLTNFNAIKHVYENEVQKMIAGSHVTDAELKKNAASLPENANFETTMKVLDSYKALAQSKLSLRQKQEELGKKGQSMTSAQPETPKGMIQARDPQGKLHQAPAGTTLPAGWKLEQ